MPGWDPDRRLGLTLGLRAALLPTLPILSMAAGCSLQSGRDHRGADAPRAQPLSRAVRTAWVLSSGGPRGFVHVGVLKALDELGLQPDLIVGASVGALVGTLHAGGLSAIAIQTLALDLNPLSLARLAIGAQEQHNAET
jgi:NTE family protein